MLGGVAESTGENDYLARARTCGRGRRWVRGRSHPKPPEASQPTPGPGGLEYRAGRNARVGGTAPYLPGRPRVSGKRVPAFDRRAGSRTVLRVNRTVQLVTLAAGLAASAACGGGAEVEGKGGFRFGTAGNGGAAGAGGGGGGHPTTTPTGSGGSACQEGDACLLAGKLGACAAGKTKCGDKGPTCAGPAPAKEACNGVDDSCDGVTDEGCEVIVEVRRYDGTSTAALPTTVFPASGKASLGLDVVFGADPGDGWMSITSASPLPLLGLAAVVPGAAPVPTHVLAPTAAPSAAQKTIFFPAYRFGGADTWAHAISLVNDGDGQAAVTVHVLADGAPAETAVSLLVPGHGAWRSDAPALLADGAKQGTGWIAVDSDKPLIASFEEWSGVTDRAADTAWPAPAKKVTIPVAIVGGAYDTVVRLATRNQLAVTIEARFHTPTGTFGPVTHMVNAGARSETSLGKDLFPGVFTQPTAGWIELAADGEIGVAATILDGDHAGIALVGPAAALDTVHYLADAAVGEGIATHFVLANPSDGAIGAVVEAYGADGTPIRRADVLVPAAGAYAGSLGELFGLATLDGWVRVVSDAPITGGYVRHDGATGVGATALHRGQGGRAIVPSARSLAGPDRTIVTIIQPERRPFPTTP